MQCYFAMEIELILNSRQAIFVSLSLNINIESIFHLNMEKARETFHPTRASTYSTKNDRNFSHFAFDSHSISKTLIAEKSNKKTLSSDKIKGKLPWRRKLRKVLLPTQEGE